MLTRKQYAPSAGFYVDYQYTRAEQFLSWLTNLIHTTSAFRNVGMIGIVNEPIQNSGTVATMLTDYYPAAYNVTPPSSKPLSLLLTRSRQFETQNLHSA
jgi:glucan endo-1,6-beta-glucosidase